jgi:hypothetical protein
LSEPSIALMDFSTYLVYTKYNNYFPFCSRKKNPENCLKICTGKIYLDHVSEISRVNNSWQIIFSSLEQKNYETKTKRSVSSG